LEVNAEIGPLFQTLQVWTYFFKMNQARTPILLEELNGVKSQWKSQLYPYFVIVRMDLFCNHKNGPILKILNIMILLSSEYNF
jgi:hypothetical protein